MQSLICVVDYHIFDIKSNKKTCFLTLAHASENCQGPTILVVTIFHYELLFNFEFRIIRREFSPLVHAII